MKTIIITLVLAVGIGIGWGIASYQARCEFEEIQQTWTPEFRDLVTQSVAIGKTMTEDERRDLLESALELRDKKLSDWNSQAYGKAFQSLLIKKLLENGEVEAAMFSSESCLERFVKLYDEGEFQGDINEELAGRLAQAIESIAEGTSLKDNSLD